MNKDMMLTNLAITMSNIYRFEDKIYVLKKMRSHEMSIAFDKGASHKEIAKAAGLSPSRVKHIILDYKKSHGK